MTTADNVDARPRTLSSSSPARNTAACTRETASCSVVSSSRCAGGVPRSRSTNVVAATRLARAPPGRPPTPSAITNTPAPSSRTQVSSLPSGSRPASDSAKQSKVGIGLFSEDLQEHRRVALQARIETQRHRLLQIFARFALLSLALQREGEVPVQQRIGRIARDAFVENLD